MYICDNLDILEWTPRGCSASHQQWSRCERPGGDQFDTSTLGSQSKYQPFKSSYQHYEYHVWHSYIDSLVNIYINTYAITNHSLGHCVWNDINNYLYMYDNHDILEWTPRGCSVTPQQRSRCECSEHRQCYTSTRRGNCQGCPGKYQCLLRKSSSESLKSSYHQQYEYHVWRRHL